MDGGGVEDGGVMYKKNPHWNIVEENEEKEENK